MVNNPLAHNGQHDVDADLEVGRPIYSTQRAAGSFMKIGLVSLAAIVVTGFAAALYFYAYQRGLEEGQKSNPPLVKADPGPVRLTPEEAGVEQAPPQDLTIYGIAQGKPDSNDGGRESLMQDGGDPEAGSDVASKVATEAPAEPKAASTEAPVEAAVEEPIAQQAAAQPMPVSVKKPAPKPDADALLQKRYMVQLAATRSRALARSTFGDMQKKYPQLLSGRDPLILRIDLGAKGIFYRVNIGGFQNRADAIEFCASLKNAGQDCLVKNEPT
jgi:cell division septation protein DedD